MTKPQLLSLLAAHPNKLEAATAIRLVGEVWPEPKQGRPMQEIIELACIACNAELKHARGQIRSAPLVRARMLFTYYFLQNDPKITLKKIADFLRKKDHTTIVNLRDKFNDQLEYRDEQTLLDLERFQILLDGGEVERPEHLYVPPINGGKRIPVFNIETGQTFSTIAEAARNEGVSCSAFHHDLRRRNHKLPYRFKIA